MIAAGDFIIIVMLVLHFCGHTQLLDQWYINNPADGVLIARAIKVGLPIFDIEKDKSYETGHVVPEADREIKGTLPSELAK